MISEANLGKRTPEIVFNPGSIAVTMTTSYPNWYPGERKSIADTDKIRGDISIQTMQSGLSQGFNVVISDRLSPDSYLNELSKLPIRLVKRVAIDRASGRRQVIHEASVIPGVRSIIRTEPEKSSLVDFALDVSLPILRGEADIVVPKRRAFEFAASYPEYMYESEVSANTRYNEILRTFQLLTEDQKDLDIFFGPTVGANTPEVLSLFDKNYVIENGQVTTVGIRKYANPGAFSNAQAYPIIEALRNGLKVVGVEIPFVYPFTQKANELTNAEDFKAKRKGQKWGILDELVIFLRYLQNPTDPKNVLELERT